MYAYSPLFPTGSVTEQLNAKRWAFTLYMSVIIRWEGLILDDPLCTLVQLDQAFPHFLGEGDFTVAKNRFRACQNLCLQQCGFHAKHTYLKMS